MDNVFTLINSGEGSQEDEGVPADDVVLMLREQADKIEAGEYGVVSGSVFVFHNEDGELAVFGWGKDVQKVSDAYYILSLARSTIID